LLTRLFTVAYVHELATKTEVAFNESARIYTLDQRVPGYAPKLALLRRAEHARVACRITLATEDGADIVEVVEPGE
jgi:hypothetical protein